MKILSVFVGSPVTSLMLLVLSLGTLCKKMVYHFVPSATQTSPAARTPAAPRLGGAFFEDGTASSTGA